MSVSVQLCHVSVFLLGKKSTCGKEDFQGIRKGCRQRCWSRRK